jgi:hypothetical protein
MKVPPKPQHRAASGIGTKVAPFREERSRSGSSRTPSDRVRWHEEW